MNHPFLRFTPTACCLAVLLLGSGCASIVTPGRFRPVQVQTQPPGAQVFLNDKYEGRSPLTLRVDRKEDHRVRFELPGREPFEGTIESGLNGWVFGNILFGGPIGLIVDLVSGATAAPKPDEFDVQLHAPVSPSGGSPRVAPQAPAQEPEADPYLRDRGSVI